MLVQNPQTLPSEVSQALCEVSLRYVSNRSPGIRREQRNGAFVYFDPQGKRLRDSNTLQRIRSLVIPPAWTNVWICPREDGHLQTTGRDARGRKQYRYHPRWSELRSGHKYDRLEAFARALPGIRRVVSRHLRQRGLTRERVLAAVIRIMDQTFIRIGCEEYARDNHSFGAATMRRRHVAFRPGKALFDFRGKSGQQHKIEINDPQLVKIIRRCHELPGHELFKYTDESGELCDVGSGDINTYIRDIAGADFTAKDFRTWGGTVAAAAELAVLGPAENKSMLQHKLAEAVRCTSASLGNRPATCRKHYIHPAVPDAYEGGILLREMPRTAAATPAPPIGLSSREKAVLRVLKRMRLANSARANGGPPGSTRAGKTTARTTRRAS